MNKLLKGKVAIITGGSRGIGKSIALRYAENGANIALNYIADPEGKNEAEAYETVKELEAKGVKALAVQADVTKIDEVKALVAATVEEFGQIDVLVNNAGITKDMLLIRMKPEDFDAVINVNLKGAFNCCKEACRYLMKTSGSIVNMASVVGINGNVGQANYAASKAGLIALTKTLAKEFASKGVRANAIAPGFIQTSMTDVLSDKVKENILSQIPLKRLGSSDEVAKVALFLASDLSSYVSGEVIKVDGGMAM